MTELENTICYLKEKLEALGEKWKQDHNNKEAMRDCLAVLEAINVLEERAHGQRITSITYILG